MLRLENIQVGFSEPSTDRLVLQDLSLSIRPGEFVAVIGGNGAGKSTMFNLIAGLLSPQKGKIYISDSNVTDQTYVQRAKLVASVVQDPKVGTIANMTLEQNLALALKRGQSRTFNLYNGDQRRNLFREKLALLGIGLEERLEHLVSSLSGGQRQALSLVMAILAPCQILLLDEITAALDPQTGQLVMSLAAQIVQQTKLTTLMITHNMQHALSYADRIVVLRQGKIVREICAEEKVSFNVQSLATLVS